MGRKQLEKYLRININQLLFVGIALPLAKEKGGMFFRK